MVVKEGYSLDDVYKIIVRYAIASSSNFDKDTYTVNISESVEHPIVKNVNDGTVTIGSDVYINNLDVSIIYTGGCYDDSKTFPYMSYIDTQNKSLPYV